MGINLAVAFSIALAILPGRIAAAATPPAPIDPKDAVLQRLNNGAAKFHATSAEFVFDTEYLSPVPDSDIQSGTVYYQRNGTTFKMAAHIDKPVTKVYTYSNGQLNVYDKPTNQVTRISKASNYESYLMLGFGANGNELADKWEIKYLGPELIDGVKTEKLELVAKDSDVRKNLNKVTIWIDPERAVSLRQRFDENQSTYRICSYSHFTFAQSLPADDFTFKTDPNPTFVNR
jgi:outer membrane lipoprotein-sorting protein